MTTMNFTYYLDLITVFVKYDLNVFEPKTINKEKLASSLHSFNREPLKMEDIQ